MRTSPDPSLFRSVIGHFATGVTVVTARADDGGPTGFTASAVCSVSLDPLLILVCVDRMAETLTAMVQGGVFAVNVLGADDRELALRFASAAREDRFAAAPWHAEVTGSPVLDGALAWLDCRVHAVHDGGDHAIVVGRVEACAAREGAPLLYWRGRLGPDPVNG